MARRKRQYKRELKADPKYGSVVVTKFVNTIMKDGKKSVAKSIVYGAFDIVVQKTKKNPLDIFDKAMKNVAPELEVKGKRIGGANYQVPYEVRGDRRNTLAFRWMIEAAKIKKGQAMSVKLASEILDAANNMGSAVKKKEDMHRMAKANKAFAHFAR